MLTTSITTPQPTHWVILAVAGESGCVLFIHLMTPSKLEKLETLTTVPSVAYFMSPPLHWGRCVSCETVTSACEFSVLSASWLFEVRDYDSAVIWSKEVVLRMGSWQQCRVSVAVAIKAHTDQGPPQVPGLESVPLDMVVTLSHFHVTIFLYTFPRGPQGFSGIAGC